MRVRVKLQTLLACTVEEEYSLWGGAGDGPFPRSMREFIVL
jgi:hypothetical protein